MQEEINQKSISIAIKTTKVTGRTLKAALRAVLRHWEKKRQKKAFARKDKTVVSHGKKSLKQLQASGQELTSIEVTDENIKSFEHCARKYGIDFSLKKAKDADPPVYYVFFKARDVKVMEAAFKEYTARETRGRESVRKKLLDVVGHMIPHRERVKEKNRSRSESL